MTGVLAAVFFLALLLSASFTAVYLPLAGRLQQLDAPGLRSAHARPLPSSGGVAVVLGLLLSLAMLEASAWIALDTPARVSLGALALLCLLGGIDDRRPLSVALRLAVFFPLGVLVVWLYGAGAWPLPVLALLTVAFVWLLNLFNFMDGIDGIAALQCSLTGATLALVALLQGAAMDYVLAALAVAGVYAGFLAFNWPPARLFMGDAGSLSAGFLLGWLALWGVTREGLNPLAWCIPMSPFLLDTALTLLRRLLRGERITQAHSSHCYQRLARHWQSHARVDILLLLFHCLWLLPLQFLALQGWVGYGAATILALLPQGFFMAKIRALQ